MKARFVAMALVALALAPALYAQGGYGTSSSTNNHFEIGAFVNYTRLHNAGDSNFVGAGGRLGFNVHPNIQLEAEGAYDFEQYISGNASSGGLSVTTSAAGLHMTHFMFGPKFQVGTSGPIRAFVTVKGGLLNFSTDRAFQAQVSGITSGDTNGVFYPGGGIEFFAKWFGLRFEAGDEMYIDRGVNHNLRLTAGPTLRF